MCSITTLPLIFTNRYLLLSKFSFSAFLFQDTNRAAYVLNMMLQRRLNNVGSQNVSFVQEQSDSFYSTPTGGPKSLQKFLNVKVGFLKV